MIHRNPRIGIASCLTALLVCVVSGCSFTTAHISSFKVGKDKETKTETDTFAPKDTIYATASVSNVPSKVTLKIECIYDQPVDGKPNYHIADLDKSYQMEKDTMVFYDISPSPNGWPVGPYHFQASMYTESGEKKSEKSVKFTVKAP